MSIGTEYKNNTHGAILIVLELEGKPACKGSQIQAVSLKHRLLPKKKVKRNQIFFLQLAENLNVAALQICCRVKKNKSQKQMHKKKHSQAWC